MSGLAESLEENVLTLLCHSAEYAGIILMRLTMATQAMRPLLVQGNNELEVRPFDLFSTRSYKRIARIAIEYHERYHQPPGLHLRDEMQDLLRRGDEGRLLQQIVEAMERSHADMQPDYVLTKLEEFIKKQTMLLVVDNVSTLLDGGHIEQAEQVYRQHAVLQAAQLDAGIWFHDSERMLAFLDRQDDEFFSSGVEALDERRCRPRMGQMFAIAAAPKAGKTWWLIAIGKHGIIHHKSVLHITLELSDQETARRYIQAMFGMTADEESEQSFRIPMFKRDAKGQGTISLDHHIINADAISPRTRKEVASKLQGYRSRGRLLIKEFPSGTLSVNQLESFFDFLARDCDFRPDLVIIDYPMLMRVDRNHVRTDLGRIGVDLRGMCRSRGFALVVAANGNRLSGNVKTFTRSHLAEDFSLIQTADALCTLSRTAAEKALNLARIFVDGCRGAQDGYMALATQSYSTGQFCLDSAYMDRYLTHEVDRMAGIPADDAED